MATKNMSTGNDPMGTPYDPGQEQVVLCNLPASRLHIRRMPPLIKRKNGYPKNGNRNRKGKPQAAR
jgi:hypothetical protein